MNRTIAPSLPDPIGLDAALLIAVALRPDVYYQELTADIPAVERAVTALNGRGWPVAWVPGSPGHLTMLAFAGGTAEQARAYALRVMHADGFIERVVAGPRQRLSAILDKAFDASCREDAQRRKAAAIYRTPIASATMAPLGSGPLCASPLN